MSANSLVAPGTQRPGATKLMREPDLIQLAGQAQAGSGR